MTLPSYAQQESDIDELLKQGKQAYINGNFKEAIEKLSNAIKIIKNREDLLEAYITLSLAYFTLGEENNSEETIKKALKIKPPLTLDTDIYSPKFINFVERVKREAVITVSFRINPAADLHVNDIFYKNTEEIRIKLVRGKYNIKVEKEGFEPFEQEVFLEEDEDIKDIKLKKKADAILPETGKIEKQGKKKKKKKKIPIWVIVGAAVVVGVIIYLLVKKKPKYTLTVTVGDGVNGFPAAGKYSYKKGEIVNYSYTLESGYTNLYVKLDGQDVDHTGTIRMDRNHTLVASSTEVGSIKVSSTPTDAEIWLDGAGTGLKTDTVLENVLPGSHTIKLTKVGYKDYEETVDVEAGEETQVSAVLELSDVGIEWILIPAGDFEMGTNTGKPDEGPQHTVYLDDYYISKYEITFEQYDKFCDETGRAKPSSNGWGRGKRPVKNVSWHDANEFCKWLTDRTGANIHLPTEAQWEKAARGTDSRIYPWGDDLPSCSILNYNNCIGRTEPVGSYPAGDSPYDVHDMAGNVYEWCQDWAQANYYEISPRNNPQGPWNGTEKIVRGGSCFTSMISVSTFHRNHYSRSTTHAAIGFRVAREAK